MRRFRNRFVSTVVVCAATALLAACQAVDGELNVARPIALDATVVIDDCMPGAVPHDCDQQVQRARRSLSSGTYNAEIDMNASDTLALRVSRGDREDEFLFSIPPGVRIPDENGRFTLAATDIGQPFDVTGDVQTGRSRTPVRVSHEACRYRVERRVCRHRTHGGKLHRTAHKSAQHQHRHHARCRTEQLSLPGERRIEYQDETVISDVTMALRSGGISAARFTGRRERVSRIELYRGVCR